MIYSAIKQWYYASRTSDRVPIGIVLHTSCVNYPEEELRALKTLPIFWVLPDNVRWELRLLSESRIFGHKAALLLEGAAERRPPESWGKAGKWDLEQLYRTCSAPVQPEDLFPGRLIFAFGDLNKLDEFLARVRPITGHFVLINSEWSCVKGYPTVFPLEKAMSGSMRRAKPLSFGMKIPKLSTISGLECQSYRKGPTVVTGRDFEPTGKSGSYAQIYTSSRFPNKYVKIYKERTLAGNYARKLYRLATLKNSIGPYPLALPETLLVIGGDQVAGFTMPRCKGRTIRELLRIDWEKRDLGSIFKSLLLLLLELHCLHILVNDLSINNILVDEDDRIYLVDCDSFQVFHYPGGGITPAYRHPEIQAGRCNEILREPRHEYFAFAVLMFMLLFFVEPLQQCQGEDDDRPLEWDCVKFELDLDDADNGRVNKRMLQAWIDQDPALKKLFADTFHFRSDHSFGAWIRALELLDE